MTHGPVPHRILFTSFLARNPKVSEVQFEDIIYEKKNGVGTITFNRPEKLNAFRMQTY